MIVCKRRSLLIILTCIPAWTRPVSAQASVERFDSNAKRDSIAECLALSVSATRETRLPYLNEARELARSYARQWNDRFLVDDVNRFATLSLNDKRKRVTSDSLRRAGIKALTSDGVPVSMASWREALRIAMSAADNAEIAALYVALGGGFYRGQNLDSSETYLKRGLRLSRTIGDRRTEGNALGILGSVAEARGLHSRALELYRAASRIRERVGDQKGRASDFNNIGLIARERGSLAAAEMAFDSAFTINSRLGLSSAIALNLANLAGVAADAGEFGKADSAFRQAIAVQKRLGELPEAAFVLHDLARLQIRRGDYESATAALMESLRYHRSAGAISEAIETAADLASIQSSAGNAYEANQALALASRMASMPEVSDASRAALALARGDIALSFSSLDEAARQYDAAERGFISAGNSLGVKSARHGKALVAYERGNYRQALDLLVLARNDQFSAGDDRNAAITLLLEGAIRQTAGDFPAAISSLQDARAMFARNSDQVGQAAALEMLGAVDLERGMPRSARIHLSRGLSLASGGSAHDVQWRLHAGLGRVFNALGDRVRAAREFRIAVGMLEELATRNVRDPQRWILLTGKWSAYVDLATLEARSNDAAASFATSEKLRAREMADVLAGSSTADNASLPMSLARVARAQSPLTIPVALSATRRSATGVPVDAPSVMRRLRGDEVMLEYLLGDSLSFVYAVTKDSVAAIPLTISRDSLRDLVSFTRRAMQQRGADSNELWAAPVARLYRELITPVESRGFFRGRDRLIIIPHGELHYLSFAALRGNDRRFIVERFSLSYAPSATAWVAVNKSYGARQIGRVLALAPFARELPGSIREANAIKTIYGDRALVFSGTSASEKTLRNTVSGTSIIHLATFGVLNQRDPLSSYVRLAGSSSTSDRLEVRNVSRLRLSGQLVILSACQTGVGSGLRGQLPAGDNWIGLVGSFLEGGAGAVTASLWAVDDATTADMMAAMHRELARGFSSADALAYAQREILKNRSTRAPFYWAAFTASGNAFGRSQNLTSPRIASIR
jgi:CHAT domain-containing protein/tetratricopeptide (TPR) repeat protein